MLFRHYYFGVINMHVYNFSEAKQNFLLTHDIRTESIAESIAELIAMACSVQLGTDRNHKPATI